MPAETRKAIPNDFGPDTRDDFHVLKYQSAFAVFPATGCMNGGEAGVPELNCKDGLFVGDTRALSRFILRLNRTRVTSMGAVVGEGASVFSASMANRRLHDSAGREVGAYGIHIDRERFLRHSLHDRLRITNYSAGPVDLDVTLDCWADFRDIFEVRGVERPKRGQLHAPQLEGRNLIFGYRTLDDVEMRTTIAFDRDFDTEGGHAHFRVQLAPGAGDQFGARIHVEAEGPAVALPRPGEVDADYEACKQQTVSEYRARRDRLNLLRTNRPAFDEWLGDSASDLALLITELDTGPYPFAGLPWFAAPFGRDAIITAMQVSWLYPDLARGVLDYLAATQADRMDVVNESAPGKIIHEAREGEMARLGEVPFHRYYGGIDQTLLFVMLAEEYYRRVGDLDWLKRFRPAIDRALTWADSFGDRDGDGLLEYLQSTEKGLRNQGWKDSGNAVFHADGSLGEGAIALVEVQAYSYAARRSAATLYRALGDETAAALCDSKAKQIFSKLETAFWDDGLGAWVLGLDGAKAPMRVLSSNAGHVLFAGAASNHRADTFAARFDGPDFLVDWGLRTIAAGTLQYNPMGYHTGSIWPHDNSIVAAGLCRYGQKPRAARLLEGLFAASHDVHKRGLPELYCGFDASGIPHLVSYPSACSPQAWAAGSPFLCLKALAGVEIDMTREGDKITLTDPYLPKALDRLVIENIPVGREWATVHVERRGEDAFEGHIDLSDGQRRRAAS
ncbi:glycogen debranching N-terminal domain-containing protein [Marinovum sp.]|uniref:amylo-alpha-1,6-glucosidase n=1 Tax=Marinovum sp. TaxID=2024839 RepID=UPI002B26E428|nr:glycogen debranching N-terminal domain-containing protein [Marinovum sp.]